MTTFRYFHPFIVTISEKIEMKYIGIMFAPKFDFVALSDVKQSIQRVSVVE